MILIDIFKTIMKLFKKLQINILLFIQLFVIRLLNIKDQKELIIWKYKMNKLI